RRGGVLVRGGRAARDVVADLLDWLAGEVAPRHGDLAVGIGLAADAAVHVGHLDRVAERARGRARALRGTARGRDGTARAGQVAGRVEVRRDHPWSDGDAVGIDRLGDLVAGEVPRPVRVVVRDAGILDRAKDVPELVVGLGRLDVLVAGLGRAGGQPVLPALGEATGAVVHVVRDDAVRAGHVQLVAEPGEGPRGRAIELVLLRLDVPDLVVDQELRPVV